MYLGADDGRRSFPLVCTMSLWRQLTCGPLWSPGTSVALMTWSDASTFRWSVTWAVLIWRQARLQSRSPTLSQFWLGWGRSECVVLFVVEDDNLAPRFFIHKNAEGWLALESLKLHWLQTSVRILTNLWSLSSLHKRFCSIEMLIILLFYHDKLLLCWMTPGTEMEISILPHVVDPSTPSVPADLSGASTLTLCDLRWRLRLRAGLERAAAPAVPAGERLFPGLLPVSELPAGAAGAACRPHPR